MAVYREGRSPDGGWGWMVIAGCFIILVCQHSNTHIANLVTMIVNFTVFTLLPPYLALNPILSLLTMFFFFFCFYVSLTSSW